VTTNNSTSAASSIVPASKPFERKRPTVIEAREATAEVFDGVDAAEVAACWMPLSFLQPWAENPRINDGEPTRRVADSLIKFGWGAVILARRNGEIVAGHTRVKAVELLLREWPRARHRDTWHPDIVRTMEQSVVPVRIGDWSESEAHLLAIADNKLNELAEWNEQKAAEILSDYSLRDALLTGFSLKDLDAMSRMVSGFDDQGAAASAAQPKPLAYTIVIECTDEQQQTELLARFDGEGLPCKPLIS
jgi:ParB-like chromosome segregation protein Spo0J